MRAKRIEYQMQCNHIMHVCMCMYVCIIADRVKGKFCTTLFLFFHFQSENGRLTITLSSVPAREKKWFPLLFVWCDEWNITFFADQFSIRSIMEVYTFPYTRMRSILLFLAYYFHCSLWNMLSCFLLPYRNQSFFFFAG